MKIVVIGSLNVDYSSQTETLPLPGETVSALDSYISPGGKGANQAVAAARLGANVSMIGNVGHDVNGTMLIERLQSEGVDTEGINISKSNTGNAQITVQKDGLNTIVVYPGANYDLTIDDVLKHKNKILEADVVIMQLEIRLNVVEEILKFCHENDITTILNPAPAVELSDKIISMCSVLTPNETELLEISGKDSIDESVESLLKRGVDKLIITLGKDGSLYVDNTQKVKVDSYIVDAIDTTAAGDSFNAAVGCLLKSGQNPEEILLYANKVGAISTTKKGAIDSLPTRAEVDAIVLEKR